MPRNPRPLVDGGYEHLIARGNNRRFLFAVPDGFETSTTRLQTAKTKYAWRLKPSCRLMDSYTNQAWRRTCSLGLVSNAARFLCVVRVGRIAPRGSRS